tara:strand:+ start:305 stop:715 length:411 start_codon:yes stop_codon:yes gene_type:complete
MLLKQRKKKSFTIELAPLIDIVFILLIFFAVSSSLISTNKAIDINLPTASSAITIPPELNISINSNEQLYIDKQQIELIELSNIVEQSFTKNPKLLVTLNADKSLPYEKVVTVLDLIRNTGCSRIALTVNKTTYIN